MSKSVDSTVALRSRVWLSPENKDSELKLSEQSDRGSHVRDSRMNARRIGSDTDGTKQGSTASQGEPANSKNSKGRQPPKMDPHLVVV